MEEEQAPPEGAQQQAQSGIGQLVQGIGQGLMKFRQVMEKVQVPDEAKAELDGIIQAYEGLISKLSGQAEAPQPPQGPRGAVSMEGGVNGRPMGPQG